MKKIFMSFFLLFMTLDLNAGGSVDGRVNIQDVLLHHVFSKGSHYAAGFVKFADGFTIMPDTNVTFSITEAVSGAIDLRTTGTLELFDDLYLASDLTFSSGGFIKGHGHAIFLGGDLVIPAGVDLRFTDSTIIDGQGHVLTMNRRAQLLVDTKTTLTLRNLILKNELNTIARPAAKCLDWYGKLALDNVEMDLFDDFAFNTGELFIHNDVVFTGSSQFIYRSVRPMFINSILNFEPQTTFFYNCSTGTNDLLKLREEASSLYFNNCTFKTTITGIQLTKGRIYFDNKVTISSAALPANYSVIAVGLDGNIIKSENDGEAWSVVTTGTDADFYGAAFNPDGTYFITVGDSNNYNTIYKCSADASNLTDVSPGTMGMLYSVAISPDGRYLVAVGTDRGGNFSVYRSTDNGNSWSSATTIFGAGEFHAVAFSPNGKYIIAVGEDGANNEVAYKSIDNGKSWSSISTGLGASGKLLDVAFHPDGTYILVCSTGTTQVYKSTNEGNNWSASDTGISDAPSHVGYALSFSPDGKYIMLATYYNAQGYIYRSMNGGNNWTYLATTSLSDSIPFSPDGRYILEGKNALYKSEDLGGSWRAVTDPAGGLASFGVRDIIFNPNGNYRNPVGSFANAHLQTVTNSILFYDIQNSVEPDAQVFVLAGARIVLDGIIHL